MHYIVYFLGAGSQGPKVIECSPVVTLIGTNKKAKGHGALYNPPNPLKVHTPAIDEVSCLNCFIN